MSLITDAMKAAQRERARRESGAGPQLAPVLVRLRTQPRAPVNRTHVIGAAGLVGLVVVVTFMWWRISREDALPAVPPLTSAILTDALADTGATRPIVQQAARMDSGTIVAATPAPRRVVPPIPLASAASRSPGPAARPGQTPGTDVSSISASAPGRREPVVARVARSGALDIAVESPRDAEATRLFGEAVAAHRAGALDVARPLYEGVLAINPNDGDALNNLGVILSAQREFDRALELLRRAAVVTPRSAGVWNNIGSALREQGKSNDAVAAFRQALRIDPNHQGARVGLAQQYLVMNSPAIARDILLDVLRNQPSLAEAHYTLGQAQEQLGDRTAAVASYSAFVRLAPARLATHVELVRRRVDALSNAP